MGVKFTPNKVGIDRLFYQPSKPVSTYMRKLAEEVKLEAVALCPISKPVIDPGYSRKVKARGFTRPPNVVKRKTPGALKASHRVMPGIRPGSMVVIAAQRYALAVHNGRRAVTIHADPTTNGFTYLRWAERGGTVVFTRRDVHQKARAPNPWLLTALRHKVPNRR